MKKVFAVFFALLFTFAFLQAKELELGTKKVFIVHGYGSDSSYAWLANLKKELEKQGFKVVFPDLPSPFEPKLEEWLESLHKQIGKIDEDTFFVGYSLGSVTILRYLEGFKGQKVGGVLLVGGFDKPLSILSVLDPFVKEPLDYKALNAMIKQRIVISAKDDKIVPTHLSQDLAQNLKAEFIQLESGGHFMEEDGFKEFPKAYEVLMQMMKTK